MKSRNFVLAGIISFFVIGCMPAQEIQIMEAEEKSVSVTGTGEVKFDPDIAEIVFEVYTSNKELNTAREENDEATQKVLDALNKLNLSSQDIQIDYLNINPEKLDNSQFVYQYQIRNNIRVVVRELNTLELIITDVLNAGATDVSGVYFRTTKLEVYQDQARKLALDSAKAKATVMADQLGQEIGEPLSIQEYQDSYSPTFYTVSYYNGSYNLGQTNAMVFRQITIRGSVTVRFELK